MACNIDQKKKMIFQTDYDSDQAGKKKKRKKVRQIGEKWIRELKNRTVINKNVSIQIYLKKKKNTITIQSLLFTAT